jgi:AcrR family transcriptional regulator
MTKGEATAERILDAAFRSIATHGCGAVTLRGIAEEAGVALSQLNYHYGNKDSLFAAVLKRMQQDYMGALNERLQGRDTLTDQIMALIDYNEFILHKSPDTYRNFLEFFNFAMSSKGFQPVVANFTAGIAEVIEKSISQRQIRSKSEDAFLPAAVTRFILSASFGIALQHFLSPGNKDVRKGFSIIKATAAELIHANRSGVSRR